MVRPGNRELEVKLEKVQALLARRDLDALLIQRVANFAWMTAGASSYVNIADSLGVASLLVAPHGRYLITNNIEAPRFREEEHLDEQGWEFSVSPWYQAADSVAQMSKGLRLGTDGFYPGGEDVSTDLVRLRMNLLPEEQERLREASRGCAEAMNVAIHQIQPGLTEFEIAAILSGEIQRRGILPVVNLIATDQRIYSYRHPLPTSKKLERYAMLVACGRKYGLVCSITRLAHFGPMPGELRRKAGAVAQIDAVFHAATRPGRSLKEIFRAAQAKYAELGYGDEWQLHHQGGPAGYNPREAIATLDSDVRVAEGQAYAWNPSITGTKSEDTLLVKSGGVEVLTEISGWPMTPVELDGQAIYRPATLEIT
jgi:Xaa-Pro aminopeptidase